MTTSRPWIVAPHTPLETLDENLWSVEGTFPERPMIRRRMHIARLSTGALLFHNAVPVDDATLEQIGRLGQPRYLVIPAPSHMLDVYPFRLRLKLEAYCPKAIIDTVRERVEVTGTYQQFPPDPLLVIHQLDGVSTQEAVLEVRSPDRSRAHLLMCDAVLNMPNGQGLSGLMLRLLGFTGGPRVGPVLKWRYVKDRKALRAHLERLAGIPGLTSVVPSHGAVIRTAPGEAVREAASRL
jgi:hypothetical protein